jgi:S-disulfanyl-L-cysteine oxidoreductase SoxD
VRELRASRILLAAAIWLCGLSYVATQSQTTASVPSQPQPPVQTVWSGVYTDAQAYRGEKVADTSCIGCHGSNLDGGDSGPRLVGTAFLENWSSQSVRQLYDWLREAMPADAAGTLSSEDATAVIAYILKLNKMPAGKSELPADREMLNRIGIVSAP